MKWLQGIVAESPQDMEIDLDGLLVNLLRALIVEQKAIEQEAAE